MAGLKFNHPVLILLSLTMLMASCYSSNKRLESELPPDALDKNTMIDLLTDIHLIEGTLAQKQVKGVLAFDFAEIYYDSLFAKYSIQKAKLDSSIAYYSRNPDVYEEIYAEVITRLSKIESAQGHIPDLDSDSMLIIEPEVEEVTEPFWFKKSQNPWLYNKPGL
ncbi:MAG: DUF4296 domain-containing protein [Bacteroidales bacterium]|nr:DUF4296 domain-containing protein [Bacteroidales bacterium]